MRSHETAIELITFSGRWHLDKTRLIDVFTCGHVCSSWFAVREAVKSTQTVWSSRSLVLMLLILQHRSIAAVKNVIYIKEQPQGFMVKNLIMLVGNVNMLPTYNLVGVVSVDMFALWALFIELTS